MTFNIKLRELFFLGDSGGPIFQWAGQYWEQIGIVSYGKGCAQAGFPGIYTRLSYYYHWIEEILNYDGEHLEPNIQSYITTVAPSITSTSQVNSDATILIFESFVLLLMFYQICNICFT